MVDRRRVASVVEHVAGGDPNKILDIIDRYRQINHIPGKFSDGLMSIRETDLDISHDEGLGKNLLKTYKD